MLEWRWDLSLYTSHFQNGIPPSGLKARLQREVFRPLWKAKKLGMDLTSRRKMFQRAEATAERACRPSHHGQLEKKDSRTHGWWKYTLLMSSGYSVAKPDLAFHAPNIRLTFPLASCHPMVIFYCPITFKQIVVLTVPGCARWMVLHSIEWLVALMRWHNEYFHFSFFYSPPPSHPAAPFSLLCMADWHLAKHGLAQRHGSWKGPGLFSWTLPAIIPWLMKSATYSFWQHEWGRSIPLGGKWFFR